MHTCSSVKHTSWYFLVLTILMSLACLFVFLPGSFVSARGCVFVRNGASCFVWAGSSLESPGGRQQRPLPRLLFHKLVVCLNNWSRRRPFFVIKRKILKIVRAGHFVRFLRFWQMRVNESISHLSKSSFSFASLMIHDMNNKNHDDLRLSLDESEDSSLWRPPTLPWRIRGGFFFVAF